MNLFNSCFYVRCGRRGSGEMEDSQTADMELSGVAVEM